MEIYHEIISGFIQPLLLIQEVQNKVLANICPQVLVNSLEDQAFQLTWAMLRMSYNDHFLSVIPLLEF